MPNPKFKPDIVSSKTKIFFLFKKRLWIKFEESIVQANLPTAYDFLLIDMKYNWVNFFLAEFPAVLSGKLEFNLTLAYDDIIPAFINHQLLVIYSTTTIYDPPVDKL